MSGDAWLDAWPLASVAADLPCAMCGKQSAHVELISPGELPAGWSRWDSPRQDPIQWRFIYDGPASNNGDGHDIDVAEAARITAAYIPPVRVARVHHAGFYDSAGLCFDAMSHTAASTGM